MRLPGDHRSAILVPTPPGVGGEFAAMKYWLILSVFVLMNLSLMVTGLAHEGVNGGHYHLGVCRSADSESCPLLLPPVPPLPLPASHTLLLFEITYTELISLSTLERPPR